jgi:hypothetical protein
MSAERQGSVIVGFVPTSFVPSTAQFIPGGRIIGTSLDNTDAEGVARRQQFKAT